MSLSNEEIVLELKRYEKESKAIREELLRICWHMRGSISYDEAMLLSDEEHTLITKIINENMETTKKTGLPYF